MNNTRKVPTQKELVMNHLRKHSTITSRDAINFYGITRLADVVLKLNKRLRGTGELIVSERKEGITRYGVPTTFAVYRLEKVDEVRSNS